MINIPKDTLREKTLTGPLHNTETHLQKGNSPRYNVFKVYPISARETVFAHSVCCGHPECMENLKIKKN